jgi:hypothetical protein
MDPSGGWTAAVPILIALLAAEFSTQRIAVRDQRKRSRAVVHQGHDRDVLGAIDRHVCVPFDVER